MKHESDDDVSYTNEDDIGLESVGLEGDDNNNNVTPDESGDTVASSSLSQGKIRKFYSAILILHLQSIRKNQSNDNIKNYLVIITGRLFTYDLTGPNKITVTQRHQSV